MKWKYFCVGCWIIPILFWGANAHAFVWKKVAHQAHTNDVINLSKPFSSQYFLSSSKGFVYLNKKNQPPRIIFKNQTNNSHISTLNIDTDNREMFYIGSTNGLFLSDNAGETWKKIFSPINERSRYKTSPCYPY
jgi:ligand-binding sensor domain-containing protein